MAVGGEPVTAELPSGVRTSGLYTFAPGPRYRDHHTGLPLWGLYLLRETLTTDF